MRPFLFLLALVATAAEAAEPRYGVALVHAEELWKFTAGSGVKVGIVDTGIDVNHPALQSAYRGGYDFVHNDTVPEDESKDGSGHGTFVAGVVLQVAPAAEIYALKIYGAENSFETSDLVRAIDWAIAKHLDVLNLSFAMHVQIDNARRAIERAEAAGIVVVAAAGNDAAGVDYPAVFDSVIAVGAIDAASNIASFSNRGREIDLVAPGVDVYSLALRGRGSVATIETAHGTMVTAAFTSTRTGTVSGTLVDCGNGRLDQIPLAVAGNVALLRMDASVPLGEALTNIVRAGAAALIVANSEPRFYYANVNPPGTVPPIPSIGSDDIARMTFGETIRLTVAAGDFRFSYGTSYASPHVAGVVALLRAFVPGASPAQIRNALWMSARDAGPAGRDDQYGWGIVDAMAAARLLAPEKLVTPGPRRRAVK